MNPFFRWYGGKRLRIPSMTFPSFSEYREPFVGGGAVFFHLCPSQGWVNDLDPNISNIYTVVKDRDMCRDLCRLILNAKYPTKEVHRERGKRLNAYREEGFSCGNVDIAFDFLMAIKFSSRGRIYGGTIGFDTWSGSKKRYKQINRFDFVREISEAHVRLKNTKVTNLDFADVIEEDGSDVFMFIDPPYFGTKESDKINYEEEGNLHERLRSLLKETSFKFLLTYENSDEVRSLYKWANIKEVYSTYASRRSDKEVVELLITNY